MINTTTVQILGLIFGFLLLFLAGHWLLRIIGLGMTVVSVCVSQLSDFGFRPEISIKDVLEQR